MRKPPVLYIRYLGRREIEVGKNWDIRHTKKSTRVLCSVKRIYKEAIKKKKSRNEDKSYFTPLMYANNHVHLMYLCICALVL